MNPDAAVVSVITSGIVAIAGITLPLFLNLIIDSRKWSRERKANEIDKISKSTNELLKVLSMFRSGDVQSASKQPIPSVYSDLLSKYYSWDLNIAQHFKNANSEQLGHLRASIEGGNYQTLYDNAPKLAGEILSLTRMAIEKMK
ncbi:hypothetical protein ANRL1_04344 [Anaerolineae bacterium]|nr:hypothetical protein ANRL1_04344 [Anaerolineae bacterium]